MADDELDILAWTMLGEAGGEGTQGMADVGHVVLNRLNSGRYGASIQDVALAPRQFSTWNSGAGGNDPKGKYPKDSAAFQRARQIAEQVIAGTIPGPPGKPLDYHASGISPYWADSKGKNGAVTRNGHVFYPSVPVPPGELPQVGTALSTVPTPRNAPAPVTPSIDMAQMRRVSAPSQLIPDTFSGLAKPQRNLGDEIGMSPIQGGQQQAPMFDAGYDTRTGEVRLFNDGPRDTQGVFTAASRAPAPVPRMPSPQLAGQRATDPALQAALNARYPAQLPPVPAPMTASDRVRGNEMQTRNNASTIASIPTVPQVSASDRVRGNPMQTRNVATTIASIPTTTRPTVSASDRVRGNSAFPTTEQIVAATGFRPPPAVPNRLMAGEPGLPELYGNGNVAGVGTRAIAPMPFSRPPALPTTQMAQAPRVAPVPFQRPNMVGTQLATQPMPPRPLPMPPMPIARPGIGGPALPAPMPATMSPFMALRRSLPQMPALRPPTSPAAQRVWMTGFTGAGTSGGAHGGKADDDDTNTNSGKGRSR